MPSVKNLPRFVVLNFDYFPCCGFQINRILNRFRILRAWIRIWIYSKGCKLKDKKKIDEIVLEKYTNDGGSELLIHIQPDPEQFICHNVWI